MAARRRRQAQHQQRTILLAASVKLVMMLMMMRRVGDLVDDIDVIGSLMLMRSVPKRLALMLLLLHGEVAPRVHRRQPNSQPKLLDLDEVFLGVAPYLRRALCRVDSELSFNSWTCTSTNARTHTRTYL